MNPNLQTNYLYNPQKINEMFNDFDIIEVDTLYLWAINHPLIRFTKKDIYYFDKLFPFQWHPLKR